MGNTTFQMGNTTFQEDESRFWSVSFVGGIEIFGAALFILESTPMEFMHSSEFYGTVAKSFPIWLIALSPAFLRRAGPATTMAGIYTALFLAGAMDFPPVPGIYRKRSI
jgi:hypothetical protein